MKKTKYKVINNVSELCEGLGFNDTEIKKIKDSIEDHFFSRFFTILRVKHNLTQDDIVANSNLSLHDVTNLEHSKNNKININHAIEFVETIFK